MTGPRSEALVRRSRSLCRMAPPASPQSTSENANASKALSRGLLYTVSTAGRELVAKIQPGKMHYTPLVGGCNEMHFRTHRSVLTQAKRYTSTFSKQCNKQSIARAR